jgi:hypothetical protein
MIRILQFFFLIVAFLFSAEMLSAQNSTWVNGYYKKDGTYVPGHYRSAPNTTNIDNWSTRNNVNPYNGKQGTRAQDYSPQAYNYGQGRVIHTGPRGGQYYYNSNGNKVYVPKRGG